MLRLAAITVLASAIAFAESPGASKSTRVVVSPLSPGVRVPLCTGFPHSRSPVLVVQGRSMHVWMPAKRIKR